MKTQELLFEQQGSIGFLTFNRPQARNALTFAMYEGIAEFCRNPPEGLRAVIVSGAGGKAFAAGTDIAQFREFTTEQHALDYEATMDRVLGDIEYCPVPTIAAISGACTGGGAVIASACDIRLATNDLRYGFPIARTLGNCLSAANIARLNALLGAGRLREMIFTSRLLGATEAQQIGLISEITEDHDSLMLRAGQLAERVVENAPLTLQATKEIQRRLQQTTANDRDWIVRCYTSEDFREGLEAFLGKRKPEWQGR